VTVLDERGEPVAAIRAEGERQGVFVHELPPQRYVVEARAPGYELARTSPPVELYDPVVVELGLRRRASPE
jgi:hypothetical protein